MKGFTLLETVIVAGLGAFTLFILVNFYLNFNSVLGADGGLMNVSKDVRSIVGETEALILPARRVLSSHSFGADTYASDTDTLVLELPSIDSSGVQIFGKYDYAVLYLDGTTAYLRILSDPASSRLSGTKQLATTVNTLALTYDNADFTLVRKVDIDIQTRVVVKEDVLSAHLHQQTYLRNY
ncbi:hypothetical protein A3A36_02875 [Candidatus Kaiserbacteria bacterium RIFCSPLOWO2_01_FULL_52_12b]|uniref:Prepilin-type N-terminal cleavage/methylation domain-containing protein n=1 Tax=Candidatus Kaiserbacteria bacterium RIFCSPLOWO2_01_FULL_52_12b TaxID=1798509 RepID=A0A1F6EWS5_9BACT|nr:MAG: hypothetical protein A3A36_02875 [Candidatus Kaiserbacteria bacterium RIFCSPLOWO2_01_FULL_52_12b]